jgi:hypothetical protein
MSRSSDLILPARAARDAWAPATAQLQLTISKAVVRHGTIIVLCIALGAAVALARGQDINFDQLNYHYYSAYAYETHRLDQDVAPGQVMHSYFCPIVYLPFYFMVRNLSPSLAGMGLGALHGLNLWLVFVIASTVARALPPPARISMTIAAVAISAASPMAISELGTSMADLLVSLPILAGVALMLRADGERGRLALTIASIALAAALMGAAASLKLTAAAPAIGLAAASAIGWRLWRHRLIAIMATGLGGVIGFVSVGGSWYLSMWRMFGNPVFPYFNTVFRSPDYPSQTALFDARYVPHSILQALSYPFLWVTTQTKTAEIPFRDIRFALLTVLAVTVLGLRVSARTGAAGTPTMAGRRLIVFFAVAFCLWLYEWSIQRYLVSLELLAGPAIVVLLQWSGCFGRVRGKTLIAMAAALAVLCIGSMQAPDWGHLGWQSDWYVVEAPAATSEPAFYVMDGEPLSYVVPALPSRPAAIEVVAWENVPSWGDTAFLRHIHALLADRRDRPAWAVASGPLSDHFKTAIARYGLKPEGRCQTTDGRPFSLTWCPLVRTSPSG